MGSLEPESDCKPEFDDSGCVQDEATPMKGQTNGYSQPQLLDLSDDVLLYILRLCSPRDLKALGFTCPRLYALIVDHTLWQRVDARGQPVGPARFAWLLNHALTPTTTELLITGFAKEADGCLGVVNQIRKDAISERMRQSQEQPQDIITADLRNNIITVTPSTSGNIRLRIGLDAGEPNLDRDREDDVAQERDDVAQNNEDVAHKYDDKPKENGDINRAVGSGSNTARNDVGQEAKSLPANVEAGTSKLENTKTNNKADDKTAINNNMDTAESDSSKSYDYVQDANLVTDEKMDKADSEIAKNRSSLESLKNNETSANNKVEKDDTKACGDNESHINNTKASADDTKASADSKPQIDKTKASANNAQIDQATASVNGKSKKGDTKASADAKANINKTKASVKDEAKKDFTKASGDNEARTDDANKEKEEKEDKVYIVDTRISSNRSQLDDDNDHQDNDQEASTSSDAGAREGTAENGAANFVEPPTPPERSRRRLISQQHRIIAPWLEDFQNASSSSTTAHDPDTAKDDNCPGPLFTFTPRMLKQLRILCPNLVSLAVEYCNINCQETRLCHFPRTLKKLSIRGIKCFNLPADKCFLFKIQDYMPLLEYLDVSECEWLEPASILGLSKISALKHLVMRDCCRLTEFVAYASLASRYGFKTLEIFDLRGSPLGDSEVSAFSWIHPLRELYVSVARERSWPPEHTHYKDDRMPPHRELDDWEIETDELDFKFKPPMDLHKDGDSGDDSEEMAEQAMDEDVDPQWQNVRWPGQGMPESRYLIISPRRRRAGHTEDRQSERDDRQSRREDKAQEERSQNVELPPLLPLSRKENNQDRDDSEGNANRETEKRKENGSGDAGDDQAGPSKRMKGDQSPSFPQATDASTSTNTKRGLEDSDASDDDADGPPKRKRHSSVNVGASTSRSVQVGTDSTRETSTQTQTGTGSQTDSNCQCEPNEGSQSIIRFRRNVSVNPEAARAPNDTEPLHKILYVNVSRRLHTVYRLSLPVCTVINSDEVRTSDVVRRGRNISTIPPFFSTGAMHLDNSSLVTDTAVRAFGESDTDNVNYIQIGPNGPSQYNRRPVRTNLRVLSITGFRNITDRSLTHLVTAAPRLELLDLSRTRVTETGVENFRSLRPECEVVYSEFIDKNKE